MSHDPLINGFLLYSMLFGVLCRSVVPLTLVFLHILRFDVPKMFIIFKRGFTVYYEQKVVI